MMLHVLIPMTLLHLMHDLGPYTEVRVANIDFHSCSSGEKLPVVSRVA